MKNISTWHRIAIAITLAGIFVWIVGIAVLDRHRGGAETIVITTPSVTETVRVPQGGTMRWKGNADTDRDCTVGMPAGKGRVPVGDGPFSIQISRFIDHGEQLAWLDVRCNGKWQGQYARKVMVQPKADARVEVARVHVDVKSLQSWLNNIFKILLKELKDQWRIISFEEKFGLFMKASSSLSLDLYNPSLDVDQGFKIRIYFTVKGYLTCRFCPDGDIKAKGSINTKLTLRTKQLNRKQESQWEVIGGSSYVDLEDFEYDNWITSIPIIGRFLNNKIKAIAEKQLNAFIPEIEETETKELTNRLNYMTKEFMADLGPEFSKWLTKKNVVQRVSTLVNQAKPRIVNGKSLNGGEVLYFSINVPSYWLQRQAPDLRFHSNQTSGGIGIKLSYALVNRLLQVLFDQPLQAVLYELGEASKFVDVQDKIKTFNSATFKGHIARLTPDTRLKDLFKFVGLEFYNFSEFKLPIRLRPMGKDALGVSAANVRMLRSVGARGNITIDTTMEGKLGFQRKTNRKDVEYLMNHIALEPVAVDQGSVSNQAMNRYRALSAMIIKMLRGTLPNDLDTVEALLEFAQIAKFELPIVIPIGKVVIRINRLENDVGQYALVFVGTFNP